jgi:hypothetical protein
MEIKKFFTWTLDLTKKAFSVSNLKRMVLFMIIVFFCYLIFLVFSPLLPVVVQDKISRISGFGVIVVMLILLALFFYLFKSIKSFILRFGIMGCVGTIIMYSLWLTIDYGSIHPYASATGFNVSEITLGLACSYLLLDKIINSMKK